MLGNIIYKRGGEIFVFIDVKYINGVYLFCIVLVFFCFNCRVDFESFVYCYDFVEGKVSYFEVVFLVIN